MAIITPEALTCQPAVVTPHPSKAPEAASDAMNKVLGLLTETSSSYWDVLEHSQMEKEDFGKVIKDLVNSGLVKWVVTMGGFGDSLERIVQHGGAKIK